MTPERMADVVDRWVRCYTRGLPTTIAQRRVDEIHADLHDHMVDERARGTGERRIALSIASRMVRGLPADASWRHHLATTIPGHPATTTVQDRTAYRRAVGVAVAAALLLVWLIGAVGIIGDSGDRPDMMYGAVLAVGIVGAVLARFRPRGMARALLATALAQALVAVVALVGGMVPSYNTAFEIVALNGFFVALFVGSAGLFWYAAQQPPTPDDLETER